MTTAATERRISKLARTAARMLCDLDGKNGLRGMLNYQTYCQEVRPLVEQELQRNVRPIQIPRSVVARYLSE